MKSLLVQLAAGVFGGLIVLAVHVYFNSNLDKYEKINSAKFEFKGDDPQWYDQPTYQVSFVLTILLLIAITIFWTWKWGVLLNGFR